MIPARVLVLLLVFCTAGPFLSEAMSEPQRSSNASDKQVTASETDWDQDENEKEVVHMTSFQPQKLQNRTTWTMVSDLDYNKIYQDLRKNSRWSPPLPTSFLPKTSSNHTRRDKEFGHVTGLKLDPSETRLRTRQVPPATPLYGTLPGLQLKFGMDKLVTPKGTTVISGPSPTKPYQPENEQGPDGAFRIGDFEIFPAKEAAGFDLTTNFPHVSASELPMLSASPTAMVPQKTTPIPKKTTTPRRLTRGPPKTTPIPHKTTAIYKKTTLVEDLVSSASKIIPIRVPKMAATSPSPAYILPSISLPSNITGGGSEFFNKVIKMTLANLPKVNGPVVFRIEKPPPGIPLNVDDFEVIKANDNGTYEIISSTFDNDQSSSFSTLSPLNVAQGTINDDSFQTVFLNSNEFSPNVNNNWKPPLLLKTTVLNSNEFSPNVNNNWKPPLLLKTTVRPAISYTPMTFASSPSPTYAPVTVANTPSISYAHATFTDSFRNNNFEFIPSQESGVYHNTPDPSIAPGYNLSTAYHPPSPTTAYNPPSTTIKYRPPSPTTAYHPSPTTAYHSPSPTTAYHPPSPTTAYYPPSPTAAYHPPSPTAAYHPPSLTTANHLPPTTTTSKQPVPNLLNLVRQYLQIQAASKVLQQPLTISPSSVSIFPGSTRTSPKPVSHLSTNIVKSTTFTPAPSVVTNFVSSATLSPVQTTTPSAATTTSQYKSAARLPWMDDGSMGLLESLLGAFTPIPSTTTTTTKFTVPSTTTTTTLNPTKLTSPISTTPFHTTLTSSSLYTTPFQPSTFVTGIPSSSKIPKFQPIPVENLSTKLPPQDHFNSVLRPTEIPHSFSIPMINQHTPSEAEVKEAAIDFIVRHLAPSGRRLEHQVTSASTVTVAIAPNGKKISRQSKALGATAHFEETPALSFDGREFSNFFKNGADPEGIDINEHIVDNDPWRD